MSQTGDEGRHPGASLEDLVELSIVVPGFNESENIERNLRAVHDVAAELGVPFEIVFVDDGSLDDTAGRVRRLAGGLPSLHVVSYPTNRGRGYALRRGFRVAVGTFVLTVESDMNYGERVVPDLYHAIRESGDDMVVASPYMKGGESRNVPAKRLLLSRWGNKVLSAALGGVVHTVSGMTRIYRRESLSLLPLSSTDKEIHLEILSKAIALGFRISEIPATLAWPDRKLLKKSTRKPAFNVAKYILSHLAFTFFERPILLFGILGLSSTIGGIALGGYIVYLRFAGSLNPSRPLMTLMVLLVIGGILLFSFGLLGMQVNDLRKEVYRMQSRLERGHSGRDLGRGGSAPKGEIRG